MSEIKTPETHPDHEVVGHDFDGWASDSPYFCDSYEPRRGYWMTDISNKENRRNVSERAIGRTYHHRFAKCRKCNVLMQEREL